MGVIHRYKGSFDWDSVEVGSYPPERQMKGVTVRVLIGPREQAPNFAFRYFEVEPGGYTSLDQHPHDHGVVVQRGQGRVRLGDEEYDIAYGDAIYVPGNEVHQFVNTGDDPFGFFCVIPALE
jgi:quercetin dioxygenase-like cupin family protein